MREVWKIAARHWVDIFYYINKGMLYCFIYIIICIHYYNKYMKEGLY